MRILGAELSEFRNVRRAEIDFADRLTALVGPNGQGKTNLLEALYCIAALRPLRSVPRSSLIRSGQTTATIRARVHHDRTGLIHELEEVLASGTRALAKDGKPCESAQFLGALTAVAFTPDDLDISKGAPDGRRRFVDRALLDSRPAYLEIALRYARALKSRNRVLAEGADERLLDAYDETIASAGAEVAVGRAAYVAEFSGRVAAAFRRIADPAPTLDVRYRSTLGDSLVEGSVSATREAFLHLLQARRERDRQRRSTTIGPHLDDLELTLDGVSARIRASQGQHRALVLAIKLAEIEHLTEAIGEPPVLLLDDISSELDAERSRQLFEAVGELDAQVVLTTTDPGQVPPDVMARLGPAKLYDVRDGAVRARS